MPRDERGVRKALRKVCSQHLWMPVPPALEDDIVEEAIRQIGFEDVDASPHGMLFELAVEMAHDYLGYGTFATVYDDEVTISPAGHPEEFDDGLTGTYREL